MTPPERGVELRGGPVTSGEVRESGKVPASLWIALKIQDHGKGGLSLRGGSRHD